MYLCIKRMMEMQAAESRVIVQPQFALPLPKAVHGPNRQTNKQVPIVDFKCFAGTSFTLQFVPPSSPLHFALTGGHTLSISQLYCRELRYRVCMSFITGEFFLFCFLKRALWATGGAWVHFPWALPSLFFMWVERALWATGGAWVHFLWTLLTVLYVGEERLCEPLGVHGPAFRRSSSHSSILR